MLDRASCTMFLGTLPKGVPKMLCATPPLMIKRTWLRATGTIAPLVLIAFMLINRVAGSVVHGEPVRNCGPAGLQASPRKMPAAVTVAFTFPDKGRAGSKAKLKALRKAES